MILQKYFQNILSDINDTLCDLLLALSYANNDENDDKEEMLNNFKREREMLNNFSIFCNWNALLTAEEKENTFIAWYNHFYSMKEPLNMSTAANELKDRSIHSDVIFLEDFKQVWLNSFYGSYGHT